MSSEGYFGISKEVSRRTLVSRGSPGVPEFSST